jgi:flagellar hook-length control protein FliK
MRIDGVRMVWILLSCAHNNLCRAGIMSINLVSVAASGGNPLAARADNAVASDMFSILFGRFLAGADAAVLNALPEEIQPLLRDIRKRLSREDKPEVQMPLLGMLSTPIELPREIGLGASVTPEVDADVTTMQLTQQMRGLEKLAECLPSKSANLAVEAEDFSQFLRENLLRGQQMRQQVAQGVGTQGVNVGGEGLQTPVMSPAWAQEFGEKIVWMARSGQQSAQLSLNPAHLGPLSITLNLETDKASATFTAATQEVRQAIEDAMPRLREMLAAAGVMLSETSVGTQARQDWQSAHQQATQQQAAQSEARRSAREARYGKDEAILDDDSPATRAVWTQHGVGMVDLFA